MKLLDWCIDKLIDRFLLGNGSIEASDCIYISHSLDSAVQIPRSEIPTKRHGVTRIVIVSDTHGHHHLIGPVPEGDVFVHCGDILMTGRLFSFERQLRRLHNFNAWLGDIACKVKLVVAGNHDDIIQRIGAESTQEIFTNALYLENTGVKLMGLSFWGTPYSELKRQSGNRAFQTEKHFREMVATKPQRVDVLISHGHCALLEDEVHHRAHLWGHAHGSYGIRLPDTEQTPNKALSICAALTGRGFQIANHPIVLDIASPMKVSKEGHADSTAVGNTSFTTSFTSSVEKEREKEKENGQLQSIAEEDIARHILEVRSQHLAALKTRQEQIQHDTFLSQMNGLCIPTLKRNKVNPVVI